jgi:16S rRNA (cytosine967-C5)-methyltransferase
VNPARLRATAARTLASVLGQQGSLATLLPRSSSDDESSALLRELCFGTCRWYHRLDAELLQLLDKPLRKKDADVHCLLLCGMYQLQYMRLPDYASINETVNACVVLKKIWAKSLINGVLRQYQRQLAQIVGQADNCATTDRTEQAQYSHPQWLIQQLKSAWPDCWQDTLLAANQHPPMTLRVNLARNTRDTYLQRLAQAGIAASAGRYAESAVYLEQGRAVGSIPGFLEGDVSVQDEASQLIPGLLQLAAGQRVLDACAAPGGKTCHILESESGLAQLLALDVEPRRLTRIEENLTRLLLTDEPVSLKAADATQPQSWWDDRQFERILLDAPCSATGIIRRQPDIKLLRQHSDIARLTTLQASLLKALWGCLAPGGILLYSTCSILPAENTQQIATFLEQTSDAQELPITSAWGLACAHGRQLLPQNHGPDGFYFAVLRKNAT